MKKFVVIAVVTLSVCAQMSYATFAVDDGFESYAVGTQAGGPFVNAYSTNDIITNVDARSGTQSLNITGGKIGTDIVPYSTHGELKFSLKDASSPSMGYFQDFLYITNGASEVYVELLISWNSGMLPKTTAGYGTALVPKYTIAQGVWHDLDVTWDVATKKYQVILDGVQVGTNVAFYNSAVAGTGSMVRAYVQELSGSKSGANVELIDNWQITPEPATMSLLAIGGLALLRRNRA